jgi:hypothetical protein
MTETALDVVDKNKLRVQKPIFDKEGDSKLPSSQPAPNAREEASGRRQTHQKFMVAVYYDRCAHFFETIAK